jgi:hypothetical protein
VTVCITGSTFCTVGKTFCTMGKTVGATLRLSVRLRIPSTLWGRLSVYVDKTFCTPGETFCTTGDCTAVEIFCTTAKTFCTGKTSGGLEPSLRNCLRAWAHERAGRRLPAAGRRLSWEAHGLLGSIFCTTG